MEHPTHPIECPRCGGTGFRVQFLQYMEQDYDAQEDAWEGDEVLGALYVASVRCLGCKRNLNPRFLDRPTVKDLVQELRRRTNGKRSAVRRPVSPPPTGAEC